MDFNKLLLNCHDL